MGYIILMSFRPGNILLVFVFFSLPISNLVSNMITVLKIVNGFEQYCMFMLLIT